MNFTHIIFGITSLHGTYGHQAKSKNLANRDAAPPGLGKHNALPLALSPELDSSLTSHGMDRDTVGLVTPVVDGASSLMSSYEAPNSRILVDSKSYNFLGCYGDKNVPNRDLPVRIDGDQIHESCFGACKDAGYKYFSMQYYQECFCGNSYGKHGSKECESDTSCFESSTYKGFWTNCVFLILPLPNWEIKFLGLEANFNVTSNQGLTLNYQVGKNLTVGQSLYQNDCSEEIPDKSSVISEPNVKKDNIDADYDSFTLEYDFNMSNIADNVIWNETSSKISLCQVVQLKNEELVIIEDKRGIDIDFNLTANFEIKDTSLAAATVNTNNTSADVSSYIKSCKCSPNSFACNIDDLAPNERLFVCIYSQSTDVGIASLESMIISQTTEKQGGVAGKIDLILEGNIKYSEITSREYVEAGDAGNGIEGEGVRVGSQVPIDMFNFGSATIEVTGSALLNLKADADGDENGGTSRKLVAEIVTSANNDEEASYELEVTLKQQVESEEDPISSAKSATNKGVAGIVLLFALASAIW